MKTTTIEKLNKYFGKNKWKLLTKLKPSEYYKIYVIKVADDIYEIKEEKDGEFLNGEVKVNDKVIIRTFCIENYLGTTL